MRVRISGCLTSLLCALSAAAAATVTVQQLWEKENWTRQGALVDAALFTDWSNSLLEHKPKHYLQRAVHMSMAGEVFAEYCATGPEVKPPPGVSDCSLLYVDSVMKVATIMGSMMMRDDTAMCCALDRITEWTLSRYGSRSPHIDAQQASQNCSTLPRNCFGPRKWLAGVAELRRYCCQCLDVSLWLWE